MPDRIYFLQALEPASISIATALDLAFVVQSTPGDFDREHSMGLQASSPAQALELAIALRRLLSRWELPPEKPCRRSAEESGTPRGSVRFDLGALPALYPLLETLMVTHDLKRVRSIAGALSKARTKRLNSGTGVGVDVVQAYELRHDAARQYAIEEVYARIPDGIEVISDRLAALTRIANFSARLPGERPGGPDRLIGSFDSEKGADIRRIVWFLERANQRFRTVELEPGIGVYHPQVFGPAEVLLDGKVGWFVIETSCAPRAKLEGQQRGPYSREEAAKCTHRAAHVAGAVAGAVRELEPRIPGWDRPLSRADQERAEDINERIAELRRERESAAKSTAATRRQGAARGRSRVTS